jgi:hypothetical protein
MINAISFMQFIELLDASETLHKADTGGLSVYQCLHPQKGRITLISSAAGDSMVIGGSD